MKKGSPAWRKLYMSQKHIDSACLWYQMNLEGRGSLRDMLSEHTLDKNKSTIEDGLFQKDLKVRQNKSHPACKVRCYPTYADNLQNIFRSNR